MAYKNPKRGVEWHRKQRAANPALYRERDRKSYLRRKYGISADQYDMLMQEQNGACAICGKADQVGRNLAVDHDHRTGKVRGLLCGYCNTALGLLADSPDRLISALTYLKAHASV